MNRRKRLCRPLRNHSATSPRAPSLTAARRAPSSLGPAPAQPDPRCTTFQRTHSATRTGKGGRALLAAALAVVGALAVGATPAAQAAPPLGLSDCRPAEGVHQCSGLVSTWDGIPLDATVTLPSPGTRRLPLVVESHGLGNSKYEYLDPASEAYTGNAYGWAKRGYAVLTYTARGFWGSCGTPASRAANPGACARGYIHLADTRYEVRDAQELIGRLVDEGVADPRRIGVTGDSYGGGQSFALAALRDRVMLPDGRLVPWRSPAGTPLSLAAAAPVIPWTDLVYAILPNSRTFTTTVTPPRATSTPVGVFKTSFANAIFLAAQVAIGPGQPTGEPFVPGRPIGFLPPPAVDPEADVTAAVARADAGEPYDDPAARTLVERFQRFRSAYHIEPSSPPPPLFVGSGFTDDLFPVDETVRFVNRTRRLHPATPISLLLGDYGHQRASNKAPERARLVSAIHAWFDHYVRGNGPQPGQRVEAYTQTCPRSAPSEGPFTAARFTALSRGEVRHSSSPAQTVLSGGGDPSVALAIDPAAGGGDACRETDADDVPGTATYRLPPPPAGGYTLLGAPTISATLSVTGQPSMAQIATRLWDVAPGGRTQTLVARGLHRPSGEATDVWQLHPNGWRFAAGHVPKLELVGADPPYARPSNQPFRIAVERLELRLPVREQPDCRVVLPTAAPILPPGQNLAPGVAAGPAQGCASGGGAPRIRLSTRCTGQGLRATASVAGAAARRVDFYAGGRRVARDRRSPFTRIVAGPGPRRASIRVSTRVALAGGGVLRKAVTARLCSGSQQAPRFTG